MLQSELNGKILNGLVYDKGKIRFTFKPTWRASEKDQQIIKENNNPNNQKRNRFQVSYTLQEQE